MKSLILFLCIAFFATACCGADKVDGEESSMIAALGTVRHVSVEGGFYGIVGDDGKNYDPVNLPSEFQKDNLKVRFKAKVLKDRVSFHMWGELIEIESISKDE